jgi:dUTP pyrophosphatase
MIIEYYKLRPHAIAPSRANPSDAGLDVFYCPETPDIAAIRVDPGQNVMLPTGIKIGIPHGYMLQVCNRSSMGAKKSLVVGAHIIDSGYDGEIFVDLHNVGEAEQLICAKDKIAQLVMVPVVHFRAVETRSDNLYNDYPITISDRGDAALGSTGG